MIFNSLPKLGFLGYNLCKITIGLNWNIKMLDCLLSALLWKNLIFLSSHANKFSIIVPILFFKGIYSLIHELFFSRLEFFLNKCSNKIS
jgi:hypothetical protein